MKRKTRLYAVVALCLALVLAVAALVTLRTAPGAEQSIALQTEPPEATASGASLSEPESSPESTVSAAPTATPASTAAPTAQSTPAPAAAPHETAKPTPAPTSAPSAAPTPAAETITLSIRCPLALESSALSDAIRAVLPSNGIILPETEVELQAGESVWDVFQRVCHDEGVALEADWTPAYNTAYVRGVGHLYEFDCGRGSGWIYRVNGAVPNVGCSSYALKAGDTVEWLYTCDFGNDL